MIAPIPSDEYWVGTVKVPRERLVILNRGPMPGIGESAMGVINLARITFAAAIAAEGYASRYWQAGGSPTTVLETDQKLMGNMAQEMADRWRESRALGPDHAPVMEAGLKAKAFGADPTTESAVEARRELVADIARYFGVPTRIVNAPTGDSETYTSTEGANMDLVRFTLQNYIGAIEDAISDLLPGSRRMEMDIWPLVRPPLGALGQYFQFATGGQAWMDPNDDVRPMLGLAPVEDADRLNPPPPVPVVAVPGGQNGNA
jgi:hypothetical protein